MAYLGVTNVFALLRLLPSSDRDKDVEILALRHQITVLERQLGKSRPHFVPSDRAFLVAVLHRLPRTCWAGSGCWSGQRQCCAGTGSCWRAATLPSHARRAQAGRVPSAPSIG